MYKQARLYEEGRKSRGRRGEEEAVEGGDYIIEWGVNRGWSMNRL